MPFGGVEHVPDYIAPPEGVYRILRQAARLPVACRILLGLLKDPVVLAIGATVGNHALPMSTVAGSACRFESQRGIFEVLQRNIHDNNSDNITAHNIGLSTEQVEQDIFIPATLRSELKSEHAVVEHIELVRGDAFMAGLGLDRLDLIKIDVEGFEIKVLEGLCNAIERYRPVMFLEWDQAITKQDAASSEIFRDLLATCLPYKVASTFDRELWPDSIAGRARRIFYNLIHKREWMARDRDYRST